MTARQSADWTAVERDFRAGILSLRELGKLHGLNHVTIKKKADRLGWERSLAEKIHQKADALVLASATNSGGANTKANAANAVAERQTIEANASVIAEVRLRHRRDIAGLREVANSLTEEIRLQCSDPSLLKAMADMLRNPNEFGQDRQNDILQKMISLTNRADVVRKLAETQRLLVGLEREAFGMDLKGAEPPQQNSFSVWLANMHERPSAALPVVTCEQLRSDDDR